MRLFALILALAMGALFTLSHFFNFLSGWFEPHHVQMAATVFICVTTGLYLHLVDEERRPLAGTWHRVLVGAAAGALIAAIFQGAADLFGFCILAGAMLGYIGFRWLKHLPI